MFGRKAKSTVAGLVAQVLVEWSVEHSGFRHFGFDSIPFHSIPFRNKYSIIIVVITSGHEITKKGIA
jgi:hypothetical protein